MNIGHYFSIFVRQTGIDESNQPGLTCLRLSADVSARNHLNWAVLPVLVTCTASSALSPGKWANSAIPGQPMQRKIGI